MNQLQEIRDGYTISSKMKQAWAIQLKMVQELLRVCNKYGLHIWADSGTLLGAVRHSGYIPWDDDIDMIMFRNDYIKLVEIAPIEFKSPLFFQSAISENHPYPIGHGQLRMDGTTAILSGAERYRYHQGIFIDIFVLDRIPDDIEERKKFSADIGIVKERITNACKPLNLTTNISSYLKNLSNRYNWKQYYKQFEQVVTRYDNSELAFVANISLTHTIKRMTERNIPIEWYSDTIMLPFEDILIPCPIQYDLVLRRLYGDYMTPVKAPTVHGGYRVLETEVSYKRYLKIYRRGYLWTAITSLFSKTVRQEKDGK